MSGQDIEAPTQAGFIPLLSLDLDTAVADALVAEMNAWTKDLKVAFPTTKPSVASWEPIRYWRGPSWAIINWLLIDGLERNGHPDAAEELRKSTVKAIETEGFAEYFDPVTGKGCGGLGFSWTAAVHVAHQGDCLSVACCAIARTLRGCIAISDATQPLTLQTQKLARAYLNGGKCSTIFNLARPSLSCNEI